MSRPDATASAALDAQHIRPVWFGFLDFADDPVRANTSGADITISGASDSDLNHTFFGITGDVVDVSEIKIGESGTDTVTVKLSGLRGPDIDLMNEIGDISNWQGRTARLWRMIRDTSGSQQGGIQPYYTGYMMAATFEGDTDGQTIAITIESYLAAFSQASNRTYLNQADYDPDDLTAQAIIAIANGVSGKQVVNNTPTGSTPSTLPGGFTYPVF
jgi:hypothetical protein